MAVSFLLIGEPPLTPPASTAGGGAGEGAAVPCSVRACLCTFQSYLVLSRNPSTMEKLQFEATLNTIATYPFCSVGSQCLVLICAITDYSSNVEFKNNSESELKSRLKVGRDKGSGRMLSNGYYPNGYYLRQMTVNKFI